MVKIILEVAGLRVERGNTVILRGINWRVRAGEHWLVIGPNGCGKTTLLASITGYVLATAGKTEVLGQRYGESDWRELRQKIGLVSSSVRQMMHDDEHALLTVVSGKYAMIDYWGKLSASDIGKAKRILERIECQHLAERPWRVLSQGERQRVLIGRALMASPRLLILDEPCAGLDPMAREHFLQFLQHISGQKNCPTLVLVTHHVEEIIPLFTHILLLKKGGVEASGRIKETLTPKNISRVFGSGIQLENDGGRYRLRVAGVGGRVM